MEIRYGLSDSKSCHQPAHQRISLSYRRGYRSGAESGRRPYHSQWAKGDIEQRLPVLHKLADLIDERTEELAKIASQEMGKLIEQSRGEVKLCAQIARYYADNAKQFRPGEVPV